MKKTVLLGVSLFAALSIVTGCGNGSGKSSEKDDQLNVTMALSEDEWKVMRNDVLPKFEKDSGIKVNAIQMEAGDVEKKLEAMVNAKKTDIDVIAQDVNTTSKLVYNGLVEDLTENKDIIPEEAFDKQKTIGDYGDKTYFLPYRPNVEINYYNKTKFDEFGLESPTNWDELLNVAKTIKEKDGIGRVAFKLEMSGDPIELVEFMRSAGGDPLVLNDEGSQEAFTYLQKLWPYLSENSLKGTFSTTNGFLAKDEVYYMPNWPFATNIVVGDGGRKDILATSGFEGPKGKVKTLGGEVLGVVKGTEKKDEAIKFIEFMQKKETQEILLEKNGWPSFRTDVKGDETGWQKPYFDATAEALEVAEPLPNVEYWGEVAKMINDIFKETVIDQKEVKPVLDKYADKLQSIQKNYE